MFFLRFLIFYIPLHIILAQRYEKNYRFSIFQNSFYQSYYNHNIYNLSCTIAQYTPISDYKISYQLNFNSGSLKGEMEFESDYRWMTCFQLNPPINNLESICIKEMGIPNANYIIFTNKENDFYYGMVRNPIYDNLLLQRLSLYNTSIFSIEECPFPGKSPSF